MKSSYAPFTCRWAGLLVFLAIFILPGGAHAQPPSPPTDVTVTPKEGELEVKWSPAKQAASYKVQWKSGEELFDDAATDNRQATVTTGTSYTIENLKAGTPYEVRVFAVNASGDESATAGVPSPAETTPLPGQVMGVEATPGVSNLMVSWDPVEGVHTTSGLIRYKVQWSATDEFEVTNDDRRYTIPSLSAATKYEVKVIAVNAGGDGKASDPITKRPLPTEVANVAAAVHADPGKLTVTWTAQVADGATGDAAGAATGYMVQWKSGSQRFGGDSNREAPVPGGTKATYDITGLEGIPHTVRVIAVNESGDGPAGTQTTSSSVATGTPRPGMVSAPRVTTHTDPQKLAVSWNAVPGATSYKVQWKEASQEEYLSINEIASVTATSTSIPETGAGNLNGVPYTVKVTAVNGSGEGMASAEATGTPKPGPVTNLDVTDGVEELRVTWSGVTGANSYTVQWRLANGQYNSDDEHEITDPSVTEYVIPELPAGSYMVQVWASNTSGTSGGDGLPVETTSAANVTGASENQVTGVRVTAEVKELTVMWNPVANATEYSVAVEDGGTPISGSPFETTRTRTVIRDLMAGTEYSVTVTATVGTETGPVSDPPVTVRPKPGKVANVEVTIDDDTTPQQLEVSWGKVTDAQGYIIQWKSGTDDYSTSRQVALTAGDEFTNRKAIIGDGVGSDTDAERDGALDGVLHTVQVIATVGTGDALVEGDPSNPATGTPKPGQVTEVTAAPPETPTPNQLVVKWKDDVPGATRYLVEWKSDSGDDFEYHETRQATPSASPYTISRNLSAAKIYTVQVTARNASGKGVAPVAETDDATGRPKPGRVATVTVAPAAAGGQLDVSWTEVVGATGYKVQWKSGMDDDYSDMRQVTATAGEITARELTLGDGVETNNDADTPLDGVLHMVQVIATNTASDGNTVQDGPASPPGRGTPKPAVVMSAPTVTVHDEPGKLTVKWEKVEGATRYKVEWKTSDGEYSSNRQASVTALEYTISGLSAANEYVVQVTAMNTSGSSAASSESAELQPRPAQVQNVRVTAPDDAGSGQQLTVEWDAVDGLASTVYIVDCKLATDASFTSLGERTSPHSISSLQAGKRYLFRVRAANSTSPGDDDLGPWSVTETGQPRPPVVDPSTSNGPTQISVTWTAPQGIEVDNYRVEWKKATGEDYHTSRQRDIPGTSTSYVIQGLELSTDTNGDPENTTYTVRVRAIVNSVLGPAVAQAEEDGIAEVPVAGQVTGVKVTPGLGRLTVQWDRLALAVGGYKVQWISGAQRFGDTGIGEYEASRGRTSYTIPSLTGGTQYTVRVVAVLTGPADGPASPTAMGTPIAATPGQVVDVEVVPSTEGLMVTWEKTDGVTGYKVEWMSGSDRREQLLETNEIATDAFNEDMPLFTIPNGTADDDVTGHPDLTPGAQYTVRVQGVNEHATTPGGRWSTPAVTSMLLPAQVVLKDQDSETDGDQFVVPGANSLTVAWNEAMGANSYKVQWKSGALGYHSSRQQVLTNPMKLEFEIPNLEPGTLYTVQVIATNALGKDGAPSDDPNDENDDTNFQ